MASINGYINYRAAFKKTDQVVIKFLKLLFKQGKIDGNYYTSLINSWQHIHYLATNNQKDLVALNEFKKLLNSIDYGIFEDIPEDFNEL